MKSLREINKETFNTLQDAARVGSIKDSENPVFILSGVNNDLLQKIASGEINIIDLAKRELEARMIKY